MNAKNLLQELLHRAGIHLSRRPPPVTTEFHSELRRLLLEEDVESVLDVGAHTGEYGLLVRDLGYEGPIHSFEPVPPFFAELVLVARRDPRWTAHQVALGSTPTTAEIRVTTGPRMSSFREASEVGEEYFREELAVARRVTVRVETLERFIEDVPQPCFLKLDTQGYDLEVIRGAGESLEAITGLQTEIAVQPLYRNVPDLPSTLRFLIDRGFVPVAFGTVTRGRKRSLLETDCLLVRL